MRTFFNHTLNLGRTDAGYSQMYAEQGGRIHYIVKNDLFIHRIYYVCLQVLLFIFIGLKNLSGITKIIKNLHFILISVFPSLFSSVLRTHILSINIFKEKQNICKCQNLFQYFRLKLILFISLNQNIPFQFVEVILCITIWHDMSHFNIHLHFLLMKQSFMGVLIYLKPSLFIHIYIPPPPL